MTAGKTCSFSSDYSSTYGGTEAPPSFLLRSEAFDDFSIVNFKFSQQFEQAIQAKQTAEQLALKAQRDLERIKIEAEQKVASAKAEAEALRLQKENVTPQLIKLRQIEASMKAIDKWDGRLPKITSGAVPFIDAKSLDTD